MACPCWPDEHNRMIDCGPATQRWYVHPMVNAQTLAELRAFVAERDWGQFHSPENLAKSVAIESAELLECFQWGGDADRERVADELADVLTYCALLADRLGLDEDAIVRTKLNRTRAKYPVDRARGRSEKYDAL